MYQGRPYPSFGYGQSYLQICPIVHPEYNVGTYAGSVFAPQSTSFVIDIHASSQVYFLAFILLFCEFHLFTFVSLEIKSVNVTT